MKENSGFTSESVVFTPIQNEMFFAKLKWTYTINEFRDFRKFKNYNSRYQNQYAKKFSSEKQERQPTEDDQCYNCGTKGHFSRNYLSRNKPEDKRVNKVEGKSSTDYVIIINIMK